jgi:hypothetical protein
VTAVEREWGLSLAPAKGASATLRFIDRDRNCKLQVMYRKGKADTLAVGLVFDSRDGSPEYTSKAYWNALGKHATRLKLQLENDHEFHRRIVRDFVLGKRSEEVVAREVVAFARELDSVVADLNL